MRSTWFWRSWMALLGVLVIVPAAAAGEGEGSAAPTPPLALPWACQETFRVSQHHNVGTHTGYGAWAWDFNLPEGTLLVAPADGTIRMVRDDSTHYGCDPSYGWDANYVVLDFGNGYEALFLHTRAGSARVMAGQSVRAGEPLAEVGNSGYVCGTHLHFQIQKTCDSWWCRSVPSGFAGIGNPGRGTQLASSNCPAEVTCLVSEGDEGAVLDERDSCFRRSGGRWWRGADGHGAGFDYTFAAHVEAGAAGEEVEGSWHFEVATSGRYTIEVHVPPGAEARAAHYFVHVGAQSVHPITIDQGAFSGWVRLGDYELAAGTPVSVRLPVQGPDSLDPGEAARRLAYDAVRVAPSGSPALVAQHTPAGEPTLQTPLEPEEAPADELDLESLAVIVPRPPPTGQTRRRPAPLEPLEARDPEAQRVAQAAPGPVDVHEAAALPYGGGVRSIQLAAPGLVGAGVGAVVVGVVCFVVGRRRRRGG